MSDTIQSAKELAIAIWLYCVQGSSYKKVEFLRDSAEKLIKSAFADIRADEARKQEKRYAACVEILRRNQRDIKRLNDFALANALPTFDLMQVETDKALADLEAAK
jgi:hypothetical protein